MGTRRLSAFLAMLIALALLAAACGDDSDDSNAESDAAEADATESDSDSGGESADTTDGAFPVTITTPTGDVTIDEQPDNIVSLSPTATENLFAIGAGDQVVAVDDQSNYPPEAPTTEGLSGIDPNIEAIADLDADLVVIQFDPGDLVSGLDALGIPTLVQPAAISLDDAYAQIDQLGQATGEGEAADELVTEIETGLTELADSVEASEPLLTYYHELDDTLYSATSSSFIGQIYALAGLDNIADPADTEGFGFPQLSSEFIVDANPNLIFLADTLCCDQSAQSIAARPGWDTLDAVTTGAVVELDDDIASRWGPRVVDFLSEIVDAVNEQA